MVRGLGFAGIAYGLWGTFPLYFALLDSVSPVEIVAHRVIWSLVFLLGVLAITRGWSSLRIVVTSRRSLALLAAAAVAITVNWTTYVYAVSTDQVVESSLGYFINPLVSVVLGVVVLRERLRGPQWTAVSMAVIGVIVIGVGSGATPLIGLVIALSFGSYGLLKKLAGAKAIPSLTVETALLFPFALVALLVFEFTGRAAFGQGGWDITLLLMLLGPVTAIPLMAYVGAATRLPLSLLGVTQYVTPSLLLIIGITAFGEDVNVTEWLGFAVIWSALALFSIDALRHSRRPSPADRLEVIEPT